MKSPLRSLALLSLLPLLFGGCLAVGTGVTERQWNAALKALEPGLTQAQLLRMMGEPRERVPAETDDNFDTVWIYSRPEVIGTRPELVGEHDIMLPNGKHTMSVPDYEDTDITVIAEYHLHWRGETLVDWERVELK
ncbi:hypothetical protein [Actomonas aquatica]|uniref:Lipoprotein SmpA/OmlA domain-containing protein n=1 Tax=Actomonas aquatica TaxID=2866162 RepID=A0ABZ1CFF6_9BACT|nr:hypothetical protein [Opitutus sp. WL0086]WRQ90080.1 hypothetical protein K1X11_011730 [Opitutus sp. WL0086]